MPNPIITPQLIADATQRRQVADTLVPPPDVGSAFANGGMSAMSAVPKMPMATPNAVPSQTVANRQELDRLKATGSGISQIQNPWARGAAHVADVIGQVLAPRIEQFIPGGEGNHQRLLGQQEGIVTNDEKNASQDAQLADTESQTAQRESTANKLDAQADSFTPFVMSKEQAQAINQPDLAGTATTHRDYSRLLESAGKNDTSITNNTRTNDTRTDVAKGNNETKTAISTANDTRIRDLAKTTDETKRLIAEHHDATSRSNNANTNDHKGGAGGSGTGNFKVPADVTKRAALASNVIENADAVEKRIQARPDIVGSAGGRYTNVQQMIGSDDPDIHEIGVRMHNIALASNGAHGVRAQGAIQKTEDELFNNFKSGPHGIAGALQATRGSMQTFLNDEKNFSTTGKRTGNAESSSPGTSAETRTYQGHTYVKGVDGWHLQ